MGDGARTGITGLIQQLSIRDLLRDQRRGGTVWPSDGKTPSHPAQTLGLDGCPDSTDL